MDLGARLNVHFNGRETGLAHHAETLLVTEEVAGVTGLEPAASGVTGRRSNQLSYTPLEGAAKGISA